MLKAEMFVTISYLIQEPSTPRQLLPVLQEASTATVPRHSAIDLILLLSPPVKDLEEEHGGFEPVAKGHSYQLRCQTHQKSASSETSQGFVSLPDRKAVAPLTCPMLLQKSKNL